MAPSTPKKSSSAGGSTAPKKSNPSRDKGKGKESDTAEPVLPVWESSAEVVFLEEPADDDPRLTVEGFIALPDWLYNLPDPNASVKVCTVSVTMYWVMVSDENDRRCALKLSLELDEEEERAAAEAEKEEERKREREKEKERAAAEGRKKGRGKVKASGPQELEGYEPVEVSKLLFLFLFLFADRGSAGALQPVLRHWGPLFGD